MSEIIHHTPYGQPNIRYRDAHILSVDCVRYVRAMHCANAFPHPLSGPPYTWVLAETPHENHRIIYYISVREPDWMWWRIDGQFLPARKLRHRDSIIVDPQLLDSPLTRRTAKRQFTSLQCEYFWTQRAYFRKTWSQILERDRLAAHKQGFDVELYPTTWRDRVYSWLTGPDWQEVVLRSEHSRSGPTMYDYAYLHWTWHSPERPNIIGPHALAGTKEVVGFLRIDPWTQSSRLDRYVQRVLYLDHKPPGSLIDGFDPPRFRDRTTVAVSDIAAGIPFPAYRPERHVIPPHADRAIAERRQKQWYRGHHPA